MTSHEKSSNHLLCIQVLENSVPDGYLVCECGMPVIISRTESHHKTKCHLERMKIISSRKNIMTDTDGVVHDEVPIVISRKSVKTYLYGVYKIHCFYDTNGDSWFNVDKINKFTGEHVGFPKTYEKNYRELYFHTEDVEDLNSTFYQIREETRFVNVEGLSNLVYKTFSKNEETERFKKWLVASILPKSETVFMSSPAPSAKRQKINNTSPFKSILERCPELMSSSNERGYVYVGYVGNLIDEMYTFKYGKSDCPNMSRLSTHYNSFDLFVPTNLIYTNNTTMLEQNLKNFLTLNGNLRPDIIQTDHGSKHKEIFVTDSEDFIRELDEKLQIMNQKYDSRDDVEKLRLEIESRKLELEIKKIDLMLKG
jgi:hypothetical protein